MRKTGALVAAAVIAACGGKAVIDPDTGVGGQGAAPGTGGVPGAGGQPGVGGQPSVGGAGLGTMGGSAPSCDTPVPVGSVENCTGTATSGTGSFECASFACDNGGNTWTTSCNETGCTCSFNGQPVCSCGGGTPNCQSSCCPTPFP